MPTWRNFKLFMLGAVWAAISSIGPAAVVIWDSLTNYTDPVDWMQVGRVALVCAGGGVVAFYRKHKALLEIPPGFYATGTIMADTTDWTEKKPSDQPKP
jgi:hypothetical protein